MEVNGKGVTHEYHQIWFPQIRASHIPVVLLFSQNVHVTWGGVGSDHAAGNWLGETSSIELHQRR